MKDDKSFFDTNTIIYLLSEDHDKADIIERLCLDGGLISVQVLNECTNVMLRKLKMPWGDIEIFLNTAKSIFTVVPIRIEEHEQAVQLCQKYQFSFYDSLIVAAALNSDCARLYSEDMQDGLLVDNTMVISNPFSRP
jgi:predicted nucleic acid-binding protein